MENREKSPKKQKIKLNTKSQHAAYFMPMLEGFAERDMLNEVIKNRVVKACDLLDAGVPLFPNDFRKEHAVSWVLDNFGSLSAEELEAKGDVFAIAGRIVSLRSFGKVAFFHIMDESGRIQCYASREELPEEVYNVVKKLDVGDIVGVSGHLFHTKTGELTISCRNLKLITRSMRPLPEKYHGLKDMETRYRQRYVDLIVTERAREIFRKRSMIVSEFRRFLEERGFMEVETPMMQAVAGGAAARPFETYHNALDLKLYMRIAPELYLKRLLVGGFEKVFELNRNFRNESSRGADGVKRVCLRLIRLYQKYISPGLPRRCRFSPTCSQYALEAIEKYGAVKGGWLAFKRLLRCNPFYKGDYFDPVP